MENVDVLVAGAAPVGLLPGTGLQRDGIAVSVIDGMSAKGFFLQGARHYAEHARNLRQPGHR
ncbi:hypothetical protein [Paraburkholderia sp. LEh10]|uniref:hypothetical protein n=1 Tax=Paraburkholderia sp. LEh10 TaxID=2821353 RepID=UPI001FD813CB|nr:hypothetical protein [Paraburkholderia sp. LEh10]